MRYSTDPWTKKNQTATSPNTFTAKDAEMYTNIDSTNIQSRLLFTKHTHTREQPLEKAVSLNFSAIFEHQRRDYYSKFHIHKCLPYNKARVRSHLSNNALLFALHWFADGFIVLIGFPILIPTHCGFCSSTFLFLHYVIIFLNLIQLSQLRIDFMKS